MSPSPDAVPFVTPATSAILTRNRAAPPVDYASMPIAEARKAFIRLNEFWNEQPPAGVDAHAFSIPGAKAAMRARLYRAGNDARAPVIVYVHGGGWTFGNVDTHDRCMRILALESGANVLGIDYRLAPEHPFPAAMDDTLAALEWLGRSGAQEGMQPARVALAGDSAGANIALATMATLRDRGGWSPATAALFYGCFAPIFDTASHRRFGDGSFGLSTARMRWYWRNYLGALPEATTALAAPLRADLRGLPRLFLNAAGLDPLLDDTMMLASQLAHAGTPCEVDVVPGVSHGFLQQTREEPAALAALQRAGRFLRAALAG